MQREASKNGLSAKCFAGGIKIIKFCCKLELILINLHSRFIYLNGNISPNLQPFAGPINAGFPTIFIPVGYRSCTLFIFSGDSPGTSFVCQGRDGGGEKKPKHPQSK
jgi:hypothetical protein